MFSASFGFNISGLIKFKMTIYMNPSVCRDVPPVRPYIIDIKGKIIGCTRVHTYVLLKF